MREFLKLIRVNQYIKNIFVFAPLFFSGEFLDEILLKNSILAFISFCFASSTIYIINDYFDIEEDKKHPTKSKRPLASGTINNKLAFIYTILLLTLSISIAFQININAFYVIISYLFLNILYSIKLKHIPIIDLNIIAIGFVLRILAGSFSTSIQPSIWILIETFLLALFLAMAKRRTDYILYTKNIETRKNISGYNLAFIDSSLGILSSLILICYIFYCISPEIQVHYHSNLIYISIIFVLNGLLRYLKLAIVDQTIFSPVEIILKDRFIQVTILCWILLTGYLLYTK